MRRLSAVLSLWIDGRSGLRSVLIATVVLGGAGACLQLASLRYSVILLVLAGLVLPLDLLSYRLGKPVTPVAIEPEPQRGKARGAASGR